MLPELSPDFDYRSAFDPDMRWRRFCESLQIPPVKVCVYVHTSGPPCSGDVEEHYNLFSGMFEKHLICTFHQAESVVLYDEQMAVYYHDVIDANVEAVGPQHERFEDTFPDADQ
jgi:hypothetical protein